MFYHIVKRQNPIDRKIEKFHASPVYGDDVTIKELAGEISDSCTLNITDVEAVLSTMVRKLPAYLKGGRIVQLGEFGRMKLSFSCKGQDESDKVTAEKIESPRIVFTPCMELKDELKKTTFTRMDLKKDK